MKGVTRFSPADNLNVDPVAFISTEPHHIWKKVNTLVTGSENSSGEHEYSVCLLLCADLLLLNPAGML